MGTPHVVLKNRKVCTMQTSIPDCHWTGKLYGPADAMASFCGIQVSLLCVRCCTEHLHIACRGAIVLRAFRPRQTRMDHRTIHLQVVGGTSALTTCSI